MAGYSYLTLTQALAEISTRLDDPSNVRWLAPELTLYLQEALRTWQSLTGYWRDRFQFTLTTNVSFYDLTVQANTLIPYTLKDSALVSAMLYHLIEPQLSGAGGYVGTDMFSLADFTNALQNRRDQFLDETGLVLTLTVPPLNWPSPTVQRMSLPDSTIDIRRAAWFGSSGLWSTLRRGDEFGARAFSPQWAIAPADPPVEYTVAAEPVVSVGLIPPPQNPGQIQLLTVSAGAALNPSAGVLLGVPDNLAWVLKWGALSDMLRKQGQAYDPARAQYCEQRWREGIQIARIHTSVVNCLLNGVQVPINALTSFDDYLANWQNDPAGVPVDAVLASWNMLVVHPAPSATAGPGIPQPPYSCAVDVVKNAPVPVSAGDFLQLGREELDVVLGYAQHLATFKEAGADFLDTAGFYDDMGRLAAVYNERLKAAVNFEEPMSDRARRDEILIPRRVPVEQAQGG